MNKFDQRFEVFFIDFGNKSLVGPKKIRRKNSSFFSHEPLAARCVLSGKKFFFDSVFGFLK